MSDGDDLLDKADALIRRHRTSIAGAGGGDGDDIPLLTHVVADPPALGAARELLSDRIESLAREPLFDRLPAQRQSLADELVAWLDTELPQVVMRVMDGVTDHMVAQVTAEARSALLPRLQAALEAEEHHGTRQEL
ncbi:MAG: hypothetical protein OHM77_12605 [Candidatus Nitricoxidivorans perseverans]|uniref:Uncharacterized protein n=1 Tax=Candidatus Nitricoxidivorans perseverans TaxID=2975601 RepID=A0AA49IWH3_9PROT|nr:MAG: hypothetical protein OHM77_12605 [Candidatus Nitricoxidivorans perseverans]